MDMLSYKENKSDKYKSDAALPRNKYYDSHAEERQEERKVHVPTFNENYEVETGGGIISFPAISNKTLYFGSCDKNIYAVDIETSQMKWKITTGDTIMSSPTVVGDSVFIGSSDGKMYAISEDGSIIWTFNTGGKIISSPIVIRDTIYFGSGDSHLYALSLDGDLLTGRYSNYGSLKRQKIFQRVKGSHTILQG